MTTSLVRKTSSAIDARYGKSPEDRNVEELLRVGIVVIDKPMGPSSHQVAAWVRDMFGIDKTGHGGTLDPRATGVLPIGLGVAVRAMDYIHSAGKRYIGLMRLHGDIEEAPLRQVLKDFTGEIYQMPPVRAAVKRELRTRTIYSLDMLEREGRDVLLDVRCEGGTYIRTLCVDIGDALGIGAHLQELRRTAAGPFMESDATTLHALRDAIEFWKNGKTRELRRFVRPMEQVFGSWKRVVVKDSAVDAICHGADLALPGIVEFSRDIEKNDRVALETMKGEILAIGISVLGSEEINRIKEGIAIETERVFMERGTYPRTWPSKSKS